MCFQLRDALKVGNIHLHSDFFSVQLDEREAIKLLRDELTRFAIVVEPAKTLFGKVCVCVTLTIGFIFLLRGQLSPRNRFVELTLAR